MPFLHLGAQSTLPGKMHLEPFPGVGCSWALEHPLALLQHCLPAWSTPWSLGSDGTGSKNPLLDWLWCIFPAQRFSLGLTLSRAIFVPLLASPYSCSRVILAQGPGWLSTVMGILAESPKIWHLRNQSWVLHRDILPGHRWTGPSVWGIHSS